MNTLLDSRQKIDAEISRLIDQFKHYQQATTLHQATTPTTNFITHHIKNATATEELRNMLSRCILIIGSMIKPLQVRRYHTAIIKVGVLKVWEALSQTNLDTDDIIRTIYFSVQHKLINEINTTEILDSKTTPLNEFFEVLHSEQTLSAREEIMEYLLPACIMGQLTDHEKIWAIYHYVHDVTDPAIAVLEKVDRATVANWREHAEDKLRDWIVVVES
ncbi:hypothetical protein GCM10008967_04810 [Bacillus carboniphilus]|uniref:Uncharacterized protein n=1 Tax=Bacillus carboniphilus TaxID=86663 RepID=A0ABN0VUG9_9BACI